MDFYPRPQLKRDLWMSLDGKWSLCESTINVPFPPQSKLSGYEGEEYRKLTYTRVFTIPASFNESRIIIHFGAVDEIAAILVNGRLVGQHEGGYLPFSFDITNYINRDGDNTLTVKCSDSLSGHYPYGKQTLKPGGMWYTDVSGIWQTVWIENVPDKYISELTITPDLTGVDISVTHNADSFKVIVELDDSDTYTATFDGSNGRIELLNALSDSHKPISPILWDTENPHIYNFTIISDKDSVRSYFALRTISIQDICGVKRVCLNDKPVFLHGILDQGYFQDGIFTPKEPSEYLDDILHMKELGFNTLRKHIKIEPDIFYYYCDIHGMLVIQDMVNSGAYSFLKDTVLPTVGFKRRCDWKKGNSKEEARREFFVKHLLDTISHLHNHPSIVIYTIFNEGWGQFESDMLYQLASRADSSRLYDSTSGWFAQSKSDFDSEHVYFRTKVLRPKSRPLFLSECGGFTLKIPGHCYNPHKTYGYGSCKDEAALTDRICNMYDKMVLPAIPKGLCGSIYTQLSDVEDEINGLYTYDRKICKVNKNQMQLLAKKIASAIMF